MLPAGGKNHVGYESRGTTRFQTVKIRLMNVKPAGGN